MVKVKIVRHSERLDYTYPLYWLLCWQMYWDDSPLTTYGHKIAADKGEKFALDKSYNPKHIYVSPYNRTLSTASEIKEYFADAELVIEPLLCEYQPNKKHVIELYPRGIPTSHHGKKTEFSYPETHDKFTKRVCYIIADLMGRYNEDIMIITHGEFLKVYIARMQEMFPDIFLETGSPPYLCTLSFEYEFETGKVDPKSIKIE